MTTFRNRDGAARLGVECHSCPVGSASGIGKGQFCPLVDRARKAGSLLYVEDETATHVWFVKSGTIALWRAGGDDESEGRVRAVRFPGSFVGLEALVSQRYTDSARAITDVVLCGATLDGIDTWLGPKTSPARTALELTLRASCMDLARRASPDGTAPQRVAAWLRDEGPRGVSLSLPRQVLADLLGMRPETLSRAIATLVKRGAIEATRRELRIVDADELCIIAHG